MKHQTDEIGQQFRWELIKKIDCPTPSKKEGDEQPTAENTKCSFLSNFYRVKDHYPEDIEAENKAVSAKGKKLDEEEYR